MFRNISARTALAFASILALVGVTAVITIRSTDTTPRASNGPATRVTPEIPPQRLADVPPLEADPSSINTIVYGYKIPNISLVAAVNDNGKNHSNVATLPQNVKFIIPLKNGRQLLYIAAVNDRDQGTRLEVKTIIPLIGKTDGETTILFEADEDYKIDSLIASNNQEWIAWWQTKSPPGEPDSHERNFFQSYKANISGILNGTGAPVVPIRLSDEKSDTGVTIHLPAAIMDTGDVLFDSIKPVGYDRFDGFGEESFKIILPRDTYNGQSYLVKDRYLIYTSYNPNNSPQLTSGNATSARTEILNRNVVKLFDLQKKNDASYQPITVAPGDLGEHYSHPIYVSGDPDDDLSIATEVYKVSSADKLVPSELQLIKRSKDGSFEKKTILTVPDGGAAPRILATGELPNGDKTIIVGFENGTLGSMGSGWYLALSGYQSMLSVINVYNLTTGIKISEIKPKGDAIGEFLGLLPKTKDQPLGIDRNDALIALLPSIDEQRQLKLVSFLPIQPKRKRSNFRSECEEEWEKKGYPNQEACDSCPVYVYSDRIQEVTVKPKTPLVSSSSIPSLSEGSWTFTADREGRLVMPDQKSYQYLDFLFPRGAVELSKAGIILAKANYKSGLRQYALDLGLSGREVDDVVGHLLPQIADSPYVFLSHLAKDETKKLLDFDISPKPDTFENRIIYAKKLAAQPVTLLPKPQFTPISRGGLTVISWGAIVE